MSKPTEIMVVLDGTLELTPAVLRAQALARKNQATVYLCSFEYERKLEQAAKQGFDLGAYRTGRGAKLEQFAAWLRHTGVHVETRLAWGHPLADKILLEVLARKPALVIKDARQPHAFSQAFFAGLDWRLLAQCPAPLMLVRPESSGLPKKILAAVDPLDEHGKPHELNSEILYEAISLSAQCDAELDVVSAYEHLLLTVEPIYTGWRPDVAIYEELRKDHAEALDKLGKEYNVPSAKLHVIDGDPAQAIVGFAAQVHADLVVMGSVYRTGLKHLFIGSTAEGVFDRIGCDVLVLKPAGFAADLTALLEPAKPRAA